MLINGSCHCGNVRWELRQAPSSVTACNCTVCRRYATLWAYDYLDQGISVSGTTSHYIRGDRKIEFHFCPTCGCNAYWLAVHANKENKRRVAVNMRLIENPDLIANLPVDHFEGLVTFEDLPGDGRCVKDLWF
ncbi:MAG: GFA family protein [Bdellovibrionota bacterium]